MTIGISVVVAVPVGVVENVAVDEREDVVAGIRAGVFVPVWVFLPLSESGSDMVQLTKLNITTSPIIDQ